MLRLEDLLSEKNQGRGDTDHQEVIYERIY